VVNSTATYAVDQISGASKAAVITAAVGTVIRQTLMQASLSELWGMINEI
jgi:hypothetical protein